MCGIVGYIGKRDALPTLIKGLKILEYRGYDSAGVALMEKGGVKVFKSVGKVSDLEEKFNGHKSSATLGIAHTRWATHGKPSEKNSHPHSDCSGKIWVVHNGIIENYEQLRNGLIKNGHRFRSETDTEVIAHLIEESCNNCGFEEAVREALSRVEGSYGLAIIHQDHPDTIVIAKKGSPLVFGIGKDEYIIASDASPILSYTNEVIYLDDGEIAALNHDGYRIIDSEKNNVSKDTLRLDFSIDQIKKGGYPHFMLKEIFEQPESIENALRGRLAKFLNEDSQPIIGGLRQEAERLRKIERLIIVSCGTSYHAGLVGKYMIEGYANLPTEVDYASEFRYRDPLLDEKTAVLAISQSGETADTLEALREAKNKGALTLGIVNVVGSSIARETDAGIYNYAGPEIGVASTKAFTSQLCILALITMMLGRQRKMSSAIAKSIALELKKMPAYIKAILGNHEAIKRVAEKYAGYLNWLYLGRKHNFPVALEGALKLKEISYVHAEGYPCGEMKHGPIAMISPDFPSIFLAPKDSVYDKVISGMEEIKAREGKIVAIATVGDKRVKKIADDVIYIPHTIESLTPLLSVIPLQLFAYYVGVALGYDVDKPRNLAKSVTVE